MANENFKITTGASLYNIKNIFNLFIDAISSNGLHNLIANPELSHFVLGLDGNQKVASWDKGRRPNENGWLENDRPFDGKSFLLGTNDFVRQEFANNIEVGDICTVAIKIKNSKQAQLRVSNVEYFEDNNLLVYKWNDDEANSERPEITIDPSPLDTTGDERLFQTAFFTFMVHESQKPRELYFDIISDVEGNDITIHSCAIVKGIIAFDEMDGQPLFIKNVQYILDGTDGYWGLSNDDSNNFQRIYTSDEKSINAWLEDFSDKIYSKDQIDSNFLNKTGDTAVGLINFNSGVEIDRLMTVTSSVTPDFKGQRVKFNSSNPTRTFEMLVGEGDSKLVYIPRVGWHYSNDDGILRKFGQGGGSTVIVNSGGSGEIEFFAEILERSGFRYSAFDVFENTDNIVNSPYVEFDQDLGAWKTFENNPPHYIITNNIFPAEHSNSGYRDWFMTPLLDSVSNDGVITYYSTSSDNGTESPSVDYSGWVQFDYNKEQLNNNDLNELYFKIEWGPDQTIKIFAWGMFYGTWMTEVATPDIRLREIITLSDDTIGGGYITIPNGASYAYGENSLEIYHNRARLLPNIDYVEINATTVEILIDLFIGDRLEFYEKYTYIDISEANNLVIQDHIDSTDAHNIDVPAFATHINSTTAHGVDSAAFQIHMDSTAAHGVDQGPIIAHLDSTTAHGFDLTLYNAHIDSTSEHGLDLVIPKIGSTAPDGILTTAQVDAKIEQAVGLNATTYYLNSIF